MTGHHPWRKLRDATRKARRGERAGWTATIECVGDHAEADVLWDDQIVDFMDALASCGGAVSHSTHHDRYSATFSVYTETPSPSEVVDEALLIFHEATSKADLPAWPVVRCEIMTFAEHDAELERPA